MSESFAGALRAELDAVVGRYEALVRALAEVGGRELEGLRAELGRAAAENERLRAELLSQRAEAERLGARAGELEKRVEELVREVDGTRARASELERTAQAARAATLAYEEQFAAERRFVEAAKEIAGSLLGEALQSILGRPLDATSPTYAALKSRGLEATLAAALKERGRSSGQAPLLERERSVLSALAAAAGCELVTPAAGTRFSAGSMEKGGTISDPAEEGNVVSCAVPGLRRAGTEGALLFPRVIVATG
jgi:hypothetical protein